MKDTLQDVVKHTHSLGFIDLVKVVGDDKSTTIDAMAEDRSVVVKSALKTPVAEFINYQSDAFKLMLISGWK